MAATRKSSFQPYQGKETAVFLPILILASAGTFCPVMAAKADDSRATIQANYEQINTDFARHDLNGVMTYFTPDFQDNNVQSGKCLDRDQTERAYRDQLSHIHSMQSRYVVVSCTPVPAGVEMEIRAHTDGTGEKKVLFAKLHGSFSNDLWVRDLWVDTPDGWRIKHRITFQNDTHTSPG